MKEEVERLTRFVENILNLSAMEAGQIQLEPAPVSLEEVLDTVCNKFGVNPAARQIQVRLPPDCPAVLADRVVLESIFNHLLDNALKYAPESPVTGGSHPDQEPGATAGDRPGAGHPRRRSAGCFSSVSSAWMPAIPNPSMDMAWGCIFPGACCMPCKATWPSKRLHEGGARFYFLLKVAR